MARDAPIKESFNSDCLLIPAPEAARLLSISRRLLWSLTRSGEIPCVRIRRRVLYDPALLRRYIASRTEGGR
jgi:excisionase family DNA binding protein